VSGLVGWLVEVPSAREGRMKEFGLFVVVRVESCEGGRGERETDTENELLNGMRKKKEGCGTQRFMDVHGCENGQRFAAGRELLKTYTTTK